MENKPMKLLLIEDDKNECNKFIEISNKRNDVEFVGITDSDIEGLKYVKRYMPEGIVLDLELNNGQGSGFEFLKEIRKLKLTINPKIVITTNVCSDSVYDYLHENKVDFIFHKKQKNYSVENVINTLILLKGYKNNASTNENSIELNNNEERIKMISEKIDDELDLIGIASYLEGRKYFHEAILYLIMNEQEDGKPSIIQYLVSKYKKSSSTISRAMQNAILSAWRKSSIEDLNQYYTAKINYETGVPTPTEFIYYYVKKIEKNL